MKQTTIKIAGKDYPLYKTMRAQIDIERSSFEKEDVEGGAIEAVLYVLHCMVRGVCIREHIQFDMDFETFVDEVEPDAIEKLSLLNTGESEETGNENPDKKKE